MYKIVKTVLKTTVSGVFEVVDLKLYNNTIVGRIVSPCGYK